MNALILTSFLKRWGLIVGFCSCLHVMFTLININSPRHSFFVPILILIGPIALSLDLAKGFARNLLLLPVLRKEIVKTWWWIGVGLPTVYITFLTIGTHIAAQLWYNEGTIQSTIIIQQMILTFTPISVMYFALTGLPSNALEAQERSGRSVFFGALWGFSIGGSMMLSQFVKQNPNQITGSYFAILLAGIAISSWGYRRTEAMLSARSTGRSENRPAQSNQKRSFFEFDSKATGFNHFTITTILQTLSFTVVFIMALATIHTLFSITSEFTRNRSWIDIIIRTVRSQGMILVVMPSFLLATKLVSLRVFRLLPLTSNEISNRFFKLVTYTIIAQNAVLFGIIATVSGTTEGLKILSHFLVVSSVGTLIIPVIVRFGLKPITFGILFPIIGVMSIGRIFFQNSIPLVGAPMIAIVIILISRYLTECIIRRSSNAYRHTAQLPMMTNAYGKG
jgi:hypothetical protein